MQERPHLFDENQLGPRRDRAMRLGYSGGAGFLVREVARGIAERVADVKRDFPRMALVGTGAGIIGGALRPGGAGLVQLDPSKAMAGAAAADLPDAVTRLLAGDVLDLAPGAADLAVSALVLHWLNDPVGHLVQLRRALKTDGLMIVALFGGRTLAELRSCLAEAEAEICGGLSPRVAPMGEIRELGALLQRAGFAMPVADSDCFDVSYTSALDLMRELRAMGETNILAGRRRVPMRRDVLARAGELYARHFPVGDGRVRATFEIVYLTGWAPGPGQPKPLRPGSARARLADALGTEERPAGEKTRPGD